MIARVVIIMQIAIILAFAMQDRPFEGQSLRCCTLIEPPAVVEAPDQKYGYGGIGMDYLEKLSWKLGFNCSSVRDYTKEGFTEFIKQMEDCTEKTTGNIRDDDNCECDFGTAGFLENDERYGRVDFLPEFMIGQFRAITHVDNTSNDKGGLFFLSFFSPSVWLSILALTTIFAFLKMLDADFSPPPPDFEPLHSSEIFFKRWKHYLLNSGISSRMRKAVESTFTKLIARNNPNIQGDSGTPRQRALNMIVFLCGFILLVAYEAGLTASLVQPNFRSKFNSIDDFICRIPAADVCVPDGGSERVFWDNTVASLNCHKTEGNATFTSSEGQNPYEAMVKEVESKNCKYGLASGPTLEAFLRGKYCGSLVLTGDPFFRAGVSFVLPRNSPFTAHMANVTLQLRNEGAILSVEEFLKGSACPISSNSPLTFQKLNIFFYIAFSLCILIFLKMILNPRTVPRAEVAPV